VPVVVLDDSQTHISRNFFSLVQRADSLHATALSVVRRLHIFDLNNIDNTIETIRVDPSPKSIPSLSTQKEAEKHWHQNSLHLGRPYQGIDLHYETKQQGIHFGNPSCTFHQRLQV
jgi:hypothetical protein